jgi:hypothetical protein
MKDSRFRFTRDGEVYFNKKKTKYTIEYNTYKDKSKIYFVVKEGHVVKLPQDCLADAKEKVRQLVLEDEESKRVWVVISEWCLEDRDAYGTTVHGVFKDFAEAKKVFIDEINKADRTMEPMDTDSEEDALSYAVWELGRYTENHITVRIVESQITE